MKRIGIKTFILLTTFLCAIGKTETIETTNPMIQQPELYIKITDWSVYGTWSAVAIIHHVTIENTGDIAYKNIKVRVYYTSTSTSQEEIVISQETGILSVTLPPHSKNTYLKGGMPLGAGSQFMNPSRIEVVGASPVIEWEIINYTDPQEKPCQTFSTGSSFQILNLSDNQSNRVNQDCPDWPYILDAAGYSEPKLEILGYISEGILSTSRKFYMVTVLL